MIVLRLKCHFNPPFVRYSVHGLPRYWLLSKMPISYNIANMDNWVTMKQFSSTELANRTGDVMAAAAEAPVTISRHGKPRFVMLSAEQYERLRNGGDTRRAFHVADLTDAEAEKLISDLQDSLDHA